MTEQEKAFIEDCNLGDLTSVKRCVKYNVDVNVEKSWGIHCAAKQKHWKIVSFLLDNGVDFENAYDAWVLEYAALNNQFALVEYLIQGSAIFKQQNRPLHWAAMQGHQSIVESLLTYMDNLNGVLVSAAQHGHLNILQLLIDNDLAQKDISRKTVLYNTATKGQWKAVELLEKHKIVDISTMEEKLFKKYTLWQESYKS